MKITDQMADALGCTIQFENESRFLIMAHPRTERALERRGLVDGHGKLTDNGNAVRQYLETHPDQRVFSAGLRTLLFSKQATDEGDRDDVE